MEEAVAVDSSGFLSNQVREKDLEKTIEAYAEKLEKSEAQVIMPCSTLNELETIIKNSDVSEQAFNNLKENIRKKGYQRFDQKIPAEFLRIFVKEMRERTDKGLRTAENAVKSLQETEDPEDPHMTAEDKVISNLRDRYRGKMRKGVPDSVEDIDLLLLAKQEKCPLVTEDKGLRDWADKLGLELMDPEEFKHKLENFESVQ